ncbi:MAG: type II secretion system F family protein [Pseudomonadota bacterium]
MTALFDLGGSFSLPRVLFALGLIIALPGLLVLLRSLGESQLLERRLGAGRGAGFHTAAGGGLTALVDGVKAAFAGVGRRATPADAAERSAIQQKLVRAGYMHPDAVPLYYAARTVCLIVPLAVAGVMYGLVRPGWLDPESVWLGVPFAVGIGVLAPSFYLDRRVAARSKACFKGLPDMMDLLVACVEAGLGLDAAVLRVADELAQRHPHLSRHIRTVGLEMRAGKARKAAWKTFADRVGLEDAQSLATMLRQAEEMGTSLGETLRVLSKDMRARRMLKAEEQAMALSAKLTLPLIVFVFPVLLGVLILPAVIRLQDVF